MIHLQVKRYQQILLSSDRVTYRELLAAKSDRNCSCYGFFFDAFLVFFLAAFLFFLAT